MSITAQKLESLGFKLNRDKCEWEPKQIIEFLGFLVNSLSMTISLPQSKVQQIQKECRTLLKRRVTTPTQLARLIGMMTACIPAVAQAPLHYRALQRLRNRSLVNKKYDHHMNIDHGSNQGLVWWIHHLQHHNGSHQPLRAQSSLPSLEVLCCEEIRPSCATCTSHRQHHSHIFYKPQRRHLLKELVRSGHTDMDVVQSREHHPLRRSTFLEWTILGKTTNPGSRSV